MSLVNENDLIIPNTVGVITTIAKEANLHFDRRINEDKEQKNKEMALYIRSMPTIQNIIQNRINGIPLENLVSESRISNAKERIENYENNAEPRQRVYEDWFKC